MIGFLKIPIIDTGVSNVVAQSSKQQHYFLKWR